MDGGSPFAFAIVALSSLDTGLTLSSFLSKSMTGELEEEEAVPLLSTFTVEVFGVFGVVNLSVSLSSLTELSLSRLTELPSSCLTELLSSRLAGLLSFCLTAVASTPVGTAAVSLAACALFRIFGDPVVTLFGLLFPTPLLMILVLLVLLLSMGCDGELILLLFLVLLSVMFVVLELVLAGASLSDP